MSYEPEKVLLQMEELRQELKDSSSNYQASVPHPIKYRLHAMTAPLNILARHLKDHQYHPATALNLNPDLKSEADLKPHRFQTSNNCMTDAVPPPTSGGSRTTTSSSYVRFTDKMNMNKTMFPISDFCFTTNTTNQDKTPCISSAPISKLIKL